MRFSARSRVMKVLFQLMGAHLANQRGILLSLGKSAIRPVELANFAAFGVITGPGERVCVWIISGPSWHIT